MVHRRIVLVGLLVLFSVLACQTMLPQVGGAPAPTDVYLELREMWLKTKPEDMSIPYEPKSNVPYAVVMDMGLDTGTATIASSILGDGSMYTSTGGGVIGGIGHENVRTASIHFVEVAANFVDRMTLVTEFPLPSSGHFRFYVVTPNGVYASEELREEDLTSGEHEFSPLFLAGNDVITAIRISSGG